MQSSALDQSQVIVDSHQDVGHHGHPDHRMFGIILFLISDSMTFLGLFGAFLIYRSISPVWPPEGTPEMELLLPTINTIILVSSSFVMHQGQAALKKNDIAGLQKWFALTAVLGVAFLCGQGYEYSHAEFGLTTNLFTSCFFAVTGFHGLHVTCGVCLILSVLWRSREEGHYSSSSHFGVEAAEIYWHFVDVIWLVLFILVYLL